MADQIPFTEQSNPITCNIDVASTQEIVKQLHNCNKELFTGNEQANYKGILDTTCISTCASISKSLISTIFNNPTENNRIILSGCGTSGRLGFFIARSFNKLLEKIGKPLFYDYLIAGEDRSLLISRESEEDKCIVAKDALKTASEGHSKVAFFGITCGLSAPYVAGQLEYCLDHLEQYTPILLGFNPIEMARKQILTELNKSFHNIAQRLLVCSSSEQAFILNPIYGPEPITGSSRMKGGTATKILLEAIFLTAHIKCGHIESQLKDQSCEDIISFLLQNIYFRAFTNFEQLETDLDKVIDICATSLNNQSEMGHIYYLGVNNFGILGIIDASECPPTFGSDYNQVRGFVNGGYSMMNNHEKDLSVKYEKSFDISLKYFETNIIQTLKLSDTVIILFEMFENCFELCEIVRLLKNYNCKLVCITMQPEDTNLNAITTFFDIKIKIPEFQHLKEIDFKKYDIAFFEEILLKWCLNTITTGAHILHGKVFENFMIDLQPTNSKLYFRAINIISRFSKVSLEKAELTLLANIYEENDMGFAMNTSVKDRVEQARLREKLVPVSILMAAKNLSLQDSKNYLRDNPVVRSAICKITNP